MTPFLEMGTPVGGSNLGERMGGEDQDFHFGHVILNISIRCQGGDVW